MASTPIATTGFLALEERLFAPDLVRVIVAGVRFITEVGVPIDPPRSIRRGPVPAPPSSDRAGEPPARVEYANDAALTLARSRSSRDAAA